MRRILELSCFCVFCALPLVCQSCITSRDDPLMTLDISWISAEFEFRYDNASDLTNSSLWAVIKWDIIGDADIDGILYKSSHDDNDEVETVGPPPQIPGFVPFSHSAVCDGLNQMIWAVNETTGKSVQCQVPCEGILTEPCSVQGVCQYLKSGYKSISRETRYLELPARFGHKLEFDLRLYNDWKTGREYGITMNAVYCRYLLIVKHDFNEAFADEYCSKHQDIDEKTHSSGPVVDLRVASASRDMANNRGVVIFEWQEPRDIHTGAYVSYYAVSVTNADSDRNTVNASEKDDRGYYNVTITKIVFGTTITMQIVPSLENCDGCSFGAFEVITYTFADIDACAGDNLTSPYCDPIANCTDFGPKNEIPANCSCPPSYDGNGISLNFNHGAGCFDLDSCAKEDALNTTCDPSAICTDFASPRTGFRCSCPDGFVGDGYRSGTGCREKALVIGLGVGIPAAVIVVVLVVAIALKVLSERRRKIEKKLSRFKILHGIEYTTSAYTISNGLDAPAFGEKYEINRDDIELKGIIGRGNFGVVQKAFYKHEDEQKLVAVKMTTENPSDELKRAFLSEISIIMQCGKHENLLGVIGCCTTGNQPIYMISEYMKYGDLMHFLWKAREAKNIEMDPIYNLTEYSIYHITSQVACGLKHLVDVKIIHGDIAARNILVGEGLKCKISDFGLANDVYRYGMIKGLAEKTVPLRWVSPERMMGGTEPITWRSDVWSFGILLYEAVTLGSMPYPNVASEELFGKLKSGYRMEKPDHCSQYLYDIMSKCWQWSPSKRPSFKQLTVDLQSQLTVSDTTYVNLFAVVSNMERETSNGTVIQNGTHSNGHV